MFRFMKKQARTSDKIDDLTRKKIEEILDEEIRKTEEEGEDRTGQSFSGGGLPSLPFQGREPDRSFLC